MQQNSFEASDTANKVDEEQERGTCEAVKEGVGSITGVRAGSDGQNSGIEFYFIFIKVS